VRYWLGRLSFAFFAVAFALGYDAYRLPPSSNPWPLRLRLVGMFLCLIAGLIGTRLRHRR